MFLIDVLLCQCMDCILSFVFNALVCFIKNCNSMLHHIIHNAIIEGQCLMSMWTVKASYSELVVTICAFSSTL